MSELQKKVLLFLLKQFGEEIREMSHYDDEKIIPGLSEEEKSKLREVLSHLFIFSEQASKEFSVSDLLDLAESWLTEEENRYDQEA